MSVIDSKIDLDIAFIIIGTLLLYFIPGYLLSYFLFEPGAQIIYDGDNRLIVQLERITLSIGLSLVMVPLTIFFLNPFLDMGGTIFDSMLVVLILISLDAMLLFIKYRFNNKKQ